MIGAEKGTETMVEVQIIMKNTGMVAGVGVRVLVTTRMAIKVLTGKKNVT